MSTSMERLQAAFSGDLMAVVQRRGLRAWRPHPDDPHRPGTVLVRDPGTGFSVELVVRPAYGMADRLDWYWEWGARMAAAGEIADVAAVVHGVLERHGGGRALRETAVGYPTPGQR
jgi:hypothetical protein